MVERFKGITHKIYIFFLFLKELVAFSKPSFSRPGLGKHGKIESNIKMYIILLVISLLKSYICSVKYISSKNLEIIWTSTCKKPAN